MTERVDWSGPLAGLAVLFLPALAGLSFFALTWRADCRHSVSDSCIPFMELAAGGLVGGAAFAWIAYQLSRGRDWFSQSATVAIATGTWVLLMLPAGSQVCRGLAVDEVCHDGLLAGFALLPVAVAFGWWCARRLAPR